jgi:hypothetical protein
LITSDNIALSVTRAPGLETVIAADQSLDSAVAEYLLAARAPNTHRAYAFHLADFETWGGRIPSTPDEIARYVAQRASTLKRYAGQIGLDAARFSGHSLRAGFVTSAALAGVDIALIAKQTGYRTQQSLAAYARPAAPPTLRHS